MVMPKTRLKVGLKNNKVLEYILKRSKLADESMVKTIP